jgi:two-component system sensor histidine kinase and response regulator WspE
MSDLGGFSLHELFRAEAETHAAALSEGLVRLEGTSDPSVVEPLMRAAHSIKGAARVVGLDIGVRLAHAMEDVLVAMQKGREGIAPARIDQLLKGTDLLASLAKVEESAVPAWSEANDAAVDGVISELRAAPPAASVAPPPSAAPAAPAPSPEPADVVIAPRHPAAVPAAAPAATPTRGPAAPAGGSSVRVTAEKLDRLLQLAGETMLESRRLGALRDETLELKRELVRLEDELDRLRADVRRAGLDPAALAPARGLVEKGRTRVLSHLLTVEGAIRRGEETSTQLYHEVLSSRMRPFADATASLSRTVRDLARQLGKDARLEIVGEQVPVDRDVLARLDAPLNHMLRNALDHGVETPDERRAQGKPPQATLRVEARHHAGMLRIRVGDDGRGIDLDALRQRIVRKSLATGDMAATLGRQELLEFLFLPGFSTAQQVTDISGRGVGLDVVQSTAREIGGTARIETELGRGTTFELELPITLSVMRALLVEVAGETLAFPLARIERVLQPDAAEIRAVEGRMQVLVEGASVGVIDAARVLALADARRLAARENLVVLGGGDDRYAVAVDGLLGEEDLVVRALDPRLGKVPHLSAAAVRESGEPVLIVDAEDLLQSVRAALGEGRLRVRCARSVRGALRARSSSTIRRPCARSSGRRSRGWASRSTSRSTGSTGSTPPATSRRRAGSTSS